METNEEDDNDVDEDVEGGGSQVVVDVNGDIAMNKEALRRRPKGSRDAAEVKEEIANIKKSFHAGPQNQRRTFKDWVVSPFRSQNVVTGQRLTPSQTGMIGTDAPHAKRRKLDFSGDQMGLAPSPFLVLQVIEDSTSEKCLRLFNEKTKTEKMFLLRGSWRNSSVRPGDFVRVHSSTARNECSDDEGSYIIVHPDILVPVSRVSQAASCVRRAVLDQMVVGRGDVLVSTIHGQMLHKLFQYALDHPSSELESKARAIISSSLDELMLINEDPETCLEKLHESFPMIKAFIRSFVNSSPGGDVIASSGVTEKKKIKFEDIIDVEEDVWCLEFGMKGMIDATVLVTEGYEKELKVVPFELKSGSCGSAQLGRIPHRAQVQIYALLLGRRYGVDVKCGYLHYLSDCKTFEVPLIWNEVKCLLQFRNEIADSMNRYRLPPVLQSPGTCSRCYNSENCFLLHRVLENGNAETSGALVLFEEYASHLTDQHSEFFRCHDEEIRQGEQDVWFDRSWIWSGTTDASKRSFRGLMLTSTKEDGEGVLCSFTPENLDDQGIVRLSPGDLVALSIEKKIIGVTCGRVEHCCRESVSVKVGRNFFRGKVGIVVELMNDLRWRIDGYSGTNTLASLRDSLLNLLRRHNDCLLREIVVENRTPRVSRGGDDGIEGIENRDLNNSQLDAIRNAFEAEEFSLILGMPGTGKTTTICRLIHSLYKRGKSVLVAAFTHTAVDNICLKMIQQEGIPAGEIHGIGRSSSIHEELSGCLRIPGTPLGRIAATTCLGAGADVLVGKRGKFDVCIVDEASQVSLATVLLPIRLAKKFVLVGDHYQLPPLSRWESVTDKMSLFRLLAENFPRSVTILKVQYRMCQEILRLTNSVIYNGMMSCANDDVSTQKLHCLNESSFPDKDEWVWNVVDPLHRVVYVDTSEVSSPERRESRVICDCAVYLLEAFCLRGGVPVEQVGIITPYRAQRKTVLDVIRSHSGSQVLSKVLVDTVDRFQGKDVECNIVLLHKTNSPLLTDWHRLNVAFSRAKKKLVLIGNRKICESSPVLSPFMTQIEHNIVASECILQEEECAKSQVDEIMADLDPNDFDFLL